MDKITMTAPAKINLFLEVYGVKEDGFHNIESIMQTVSLCDTLDIERTDAGISLTGNEEKLKCGPNNLIIKAATAFFEETRCQGGASFHLNKQIPLAAGLGGGSADAAATLIGLNILYETDLTLKQLYAIGAKLGADVPFCIKRGTCLASGIGEMVIRGPDIPDCMIVIAMGCGQISTRWAFHRIDDITDRKIIEIEGMISAVHSRDITKIAAHVYNAFEEVSPYERQIKKIMLENGALGSAMSGSGPAIYGIYNDREKADQTNRALVKAGYKTFVCRPVDKNWAGRRV